MAQVASAGALLLMALRDLYDAEAALAERLPVVLAHASFHNFKQFIEADRERSVRQHADLDRLTRALGGDPDGEPCVWMRAVLDDSDNDAATIAAGPLRDIALVGALRKGKQAERVSYETALALAERLDLADAAATLRTIRDEEQAADETLAALLVQLAGEIA